MRRICGPEPSGRCPNEPLMPGSTSHTGFPAASTRNLRIPWPSCHAQTKYSAGRSSPGARVRCSLAVRRVAAPGRGGRARLHGVHIGIALRLSPSRIGPSTSGLMQMPGADGDLLEAGAPDQELVFRSRDVVPPLSRRCTMIAPHRQCRDVVALPGPAHRKEGEAVKSRVAMVIPDTGLDDEPISPVSRATRSQRSPAAR